MTWWILAAVAVLIVGFAARAGLFSLLRKQPRSRRGVIAWEDRGPTPLGEKGYTPQGLTWVEGRLIFANTWKDAKSRVYEIDPETMEILRTFDMPEGAVHTSGLAWDGESLWAVDYRGNRAYRIDLERSLAEGEVRVLGSFDTTLEGTSACCVVPGEGGNLLAISDFMHTRRTILVRPEEALAAGTAKDAIEFSYRNQGFSQGLVLIEGSLWESENKLGKDVLNRMDLGKLRETGDSGRATVRQFDAPSKGVEDLAWDGARLWTSDESVFRFFCAPLEDPSGDPR